MMTIRFSISAVFKARLALLLLLVVSAVRLPAAEAFDLTTEFQSGLKPRAPKTRTCVSGRYKSVPVAGTDADAYYFRIVRRVVKIVGLPSTVDAMAKLPKSDDRKVALAALLRDRTSAGNSWIARRLAMGHSGSVSRMIGSCRKSGELASIVKQIANAPDEA